VWVTDAAIAAWKAAPRTTPGGQALYSDLAVGTALTLRAVFHLAGDVPAHVANGRALLINDYAASPLQARPPSPVTGAKRAA
jgi:hypothetical protein